MSVRVVGLSGSFSRPSRMRVLVDAADAAFQDRQVVSKLQFDRAVGQFAPFLMPAGRLCPAAIPAYSNGTARA